MAQSAIRSCEICERGPGNNFCLNCEQFLCDDCKKLHGRQTISKNHKFKSDSGAIPEVKSRCKEHDDDFIFLCVQCDVPVCRRCVSGKHKGHDMSNIDDVIAELKNSARKAIESKSKQNDDVIQILVKGLKSVESDETYVIKKIKEEGIKMKELIDQETEKKIALCKENVIREKEKINDMLVEARELKKTNIGLKKLLDELKNNIEDVSLVEKLKAHIVSVDSLTNLSVPTLLTVKYASKSIKIDDITNLMGTYTMKELTIDTKPTSEKQQTRSKKLPKTSLYIDDVLSINNPSFAAWVPSIYPPELEIKETIDTTCSTSFLNLHLEFDTNGHLSIKIYDKRDDCNFKRINFLNKKSNIPASPAYEILVEIAQAS